MSISRRDFVTSAAALGVAGALGPILAPAQETKKAQPIHNRFAVATYSFWQFRNRDLRDIGKCIDLAADMGFDGVEILHRQMEKEDNATLQDIKRRAFQNGLDLMGFSTHQTFLRADAAER